MTRILVISFSELASDPRVDRQIDALRTRYEVVAAGLGPPRCEDVSFIDLSTPRRHPLGRALGLWRLLTRRFGDVYWKHPANIVALGRLRDVDVDAVVANDLSALPLALSLGPPVVFDAHEYAPDELGHQVLWRVVMRPYARWLCDTYIPTTSAMTTVARGIADAYERDTGVRAIVVLNAPPFLDVEPTPVHHPIRILHHGAAQPGRGLEEMIRLGDLLDERFTLDFVLIEGARGYRDELVRGARHNPRIRFPDPVPMHNIVQMANAYDVGLYSLSPRNYNQLHALPNKFFEFIQARLALVIGPSPEMKRLVNDYRCGIVATDFSAEALSIVLNQLDSNSLAALKRASHVAAVELCAEKNAPIVQKSVEDALDTRVRVA